MSPAHPKLWFDRIRHRRHREQPLDEPPPADAKAEHITADTLHPAYRRQADVYQFPVAQQGLEVSDRAWFVYANGLKTADGFRDTLRFDTRLVPYDGDRSWVLEALRAAVSLALSGQRPDPGPECRWCRFAATWAQRQLFSLPTA